MAGVARLNSRAIRCLVANKNYFRVLVIQMGKNNSPDDDDRFDHAPNLYFNDDKLKFDTNYVDNTNQNFGSASGFVPKSLLFIKGIAIFLAIPLS